MKKYIALLLALLLLMGTAPAAFAVPAPADQSLADQPAENLPAADHPVLPNGHPESRRGEIPQPKIVQPLPEAEIQAASALDVTVEQTGELPGPVTWRVTVNGTGDYTYQFDAVLPTEENGETINYSYGGQDLGPSNEYSFTFPENGEWEIWIDIYDGDVYKGREVQNVSVHVEGMDPLRISISEPQGGFFSGDTVWTIGFSGGDGNYRYHICLNETDSGLIGENAVSVLEGETTENSVAFSYRFLASGNYELEVFLYKGNTFGEYVNQEFAAVDENVPSVSQKVTELVQECRAAGNTTDYEIALWMHDWLTHNANYDYTYSHYSADGVLLGGTGVCDSYSKAFLFLMREAGIPVIRITNYNHAWNAVQIEGEWYALDCTWDDPGEGGNEYHVYCFIPDAAMDVDHKNHNSTVSCTSVAYNYYVQTGAAQPYAANLSARAQSGLQSGDYLYSVTFPERYVLEGYLFNDRSRAGAVLCDWLSMALAGEETYTYAGEPVELLFFAEPGDTAASVQVSFEGKVLELPQELTRIGEEAFSGDADLRAVIIPDQTRAIEAGAFADIDGLWMALIPESVTEIGEGAFDSSNPHLTIVAPSGSAAETYANAHQMKFREAGAAEA